MNRTEITFQEALQHLNIEDYRERIVRSNSHGELFHLLDYIYIAQAQIKTQIDFSDFRPWFEEVVKMAEENWQRPESVFQYIPKLLTETLCKEINNEYI